MQALQDNKAAGFPERARLVGRKRHGGELVGWSEVGGWEMSEWRLKSEMDQRGYRWVTVAGGRGGGLAMTFSTTHVLMFVNGVLDLVSRGSGAL